MAVISSPDDLFKIGFQDVDYQKLGFLNFDTSPQTFRAKTFNLQNESFTTLFFITLFAFLDTFSHN
jgi:hypothetical protein